MRALWSRLLQLASLLGLWLLLWGRVTVANVVGGVLVIGLVLLVAPTGPGVTASEDRTRFRPISAVIFAAVFLKALVVATWQVAVVVVFPSRVRSGVVRVPLSVRSPLVATAVANAVTLTPGTMTIDELQSGDGVVLFVHALIADDPDKIREDVWVFERHAVKSFGSTRDREAIFRKTEQ